MSGAKQRVANHRIYCAGPLFNRGEQGEMAEIARTLEDAGFSVFLPHRDSFLFSDVHREFLQGGYESAEATPIIRRAIFCVDVYEVVSACQGLVFNMNGRVPDEGAVAECTMAWMVGKPIVLYKSDSRSVIQGEDNELVLGLGNFVKVPTIPEIAYAFTQLFRAWRPKRDRVPPPLVKDAVESGRRLSRLLASCKDPAGIVPILLSLARRSSRASQG